MSMTATIATLNPGTTVLGQPVNFVVTVNNTGGSNFSVTEIQPTILFSGNTAPVDGSSAELGKVFLGNNLIQAGTSLDFYFSVCFNTPSINYDGTTGAFLIGCKVQNTIADPNVSESSPVSMIVTQVPKEASTP